MKVQTLLEQFKFHEFGYFRNLFSNPISEAIQKGLCNIVFFCPKIGLEFFDLNIVVPRMNDFLSILLSEE